MSDFGLEFDIEVPKLSPLMSVLDIAGKDIGVKGALTTAAIMVQRLARENAPVRSGRLYNSIGYKVNGMTAVIAPTVDYGIYVEMGTGLFGPKGQLIYPTSKRVLASKINPGWGEKNGAGYFIIGKYSKGQEANPFFAKTAEEALPVVEGVFKMIPVGLSKTIGEA